MPVKHHIKRSTTYGRVGQGTAKGIARVMSGKGHVPRFDRILPKTMDRLIAMGLFEPWEGTYRITAKGRQLLNELELEANLSDPLPHRSNASGA